MSWHNFRLMAPALALLVALIPVVTTHAQSSAVEILEVRTDAFPRVVVRLKATDDEAISQNGLTLENMQVIENGEVQPSADLMQIRNPITPTSVALAIDVSGSMADEDKLAQAQSAAKLFTEQMRPRDQIAVLSFGDDVKVPQRLTRDRKLLARAIEKLTAGGNTRLYDGLAQSLTQITSAPSGARAVVLLTDGRDTTSERTPRDILAQAVAAGVPVYAIGLGSDLDADALERLASSTGGRYYQAPTGDDLTRVFRLISRQLTSQYEVSWESTSRPLAGQEVSVQISIEARDQFSPSTVAFSYVAPTFGRPSHTDPENLSRTLLEVSPTGAPTQQQVLTAGLIAGASALLLFFGMLRRRVNRRLHARLVAYVAGRPPVTSPVVGMSTLASRRGRVSPLTAAAARITARLVPGRQIQRLRRKLIQAGHPSDQHLSVFLAAELALAILLGFAAYEVLQVSGYGQRSPLMVGGIAALVAAFGMYLPYMWLRRRVEFRQRLLLRALPDALDLMAIAVTAGLSLDSAMTEVVQKWDGELSRELHQVLNEMRMGASRRQALRDLAERTQLPDVQLLVAALLQADELGANVSETLAVQAHQLRVRRRQVAEEKARKAPVKMLVPLVACIFPAMFVVILAPALIQFFNAFGSMAHR